MATANLQVTGMKCGGCENSVKGAVQACTGVSNVTASHKTGAVEVQYDDAQTSLDTIKRSIEAKGFGVA